jgi:hypothetical protein
MRTDDNPPAGPRFADPIDAAHYAAGPGIPEPATGGLAVEPQQVVLGKSESADGRVEF